jgi:hypothetical protein
LVIASILEIGFISGANAACDAGTLGGCTVIALPIVGAMVVVAAGQAAIGAGLIGHGGLVLGINNLNPIGTDIPQNSTKKIIEGLVGGKQPGVKVVDSAEDLQSLYNELSKGGKTISWKNYDGMVVELPDGTQIGIRQISKTGGPTIDIVYPDGSIGKVHVK